MVDQYSSTNYTLNGIDGTLGEYTTDTPMVDLESAQEIELFLQAQVKEVVPLFLQAQVEVEVPFTLVENMEDSSSDLSSLDTERDFADSWD